jgi:hypothetical protein
MTIETFVRTSGAVIGIARDAFGPGGGITLAPVAAGDPPPAPNASGRAADRSSAESHDVQAAVATLNEHDHTGHQQLSDAVSAAGTGRSRMDRIIAAALADVGDADISTPQGQRALVEAITRHLEDSKGTLDGAGVDAGTRAAAARTTAAGYSAAAPQMQPAAMMPTTGMPTMGGGPPTSGVSGMPGLGALANLMHGPNNTAEAASATSPSAEPEPGGVSAAPLIGQDPRSVARYIYQQARAHGYSEHEALAITAYAKGESGFNPTSSGGPQGGSGAENVVIGNFQEKPQFARDAGLDPAQRYTVEGNTEIYLRTLAHHRNDPGDILDHLLATSVGGPMVTGGRAKMAELMAQTRDLLTGTTSI